MTILKSQGLIINVGIIIGIMLGMSGFSESMIKMGFVKNKAFEVGVLAQKEIEVNWRRIRQLKDEIKKIEDENSNLLISVLRENGITLEKGQSCTLNKDWTITFYKEGLK